MGTTLTGTTPQDTYDSLIKVTDNGPLSGTAKYLSDGLGNDSALAVSTSKVGVGTASLSLGKLVVKDSAFQYIAEPTDTATYGYLGIGHFTNGAFIGTTAGSNTVSDILRFGTSGTERMRITSAGNVGIGTSSPVGFASDDVVLQVHNATASPAASRSIFRLTNSYTGSTFGNGSGLLVDNNVHLNVINYENADIVFLSNNGSSVTEKARFLAGGGLTFNGDTAAANALDDYEEGTFTPTIIGSTTAGTATYGGGQAGTYTKIGNVVYFQIYLGYSGGTGTGDLRIAGLPFTIPASDLPSFTFGVFLNVALTALNVPIAGGIGSTNQIYINQIPTGGGSQTSVPYDDSAVIQISGFYRV